MQTANAVHTANAPYRIHRYPTQLIERWTLRHGERATLRPVLPQDQKPVQDFVAALSLAARRERFHGGIVGLSAKRAAEMTCIDYRRDMACVVTVVDGTGDAAHEIVIADGRYTLTEDGLCAEFAIVVGDAWRGLGVGRRLMSALLASAQRADVRWLCGEVLADNRDMLALMQRCGFSICPHPSESELLRVEREVHGAALEADNDSIFGGLTQALPRWWRKRRGEVHLLLI